MIILDIRRSMYFSLRRRTTFAIDIQKRGEKMKYKMTGTIQKVAALALSVILTLELTACGSSNSAAASSAAVSGASSSASVAASTATATHSKTATVAVGENITKLNPLDQFQATGNAIINMVYEPLVESDHEGNYTPCLATEWKTSDDGTVWTFTLRKGVQFNDGEDFNADDVVCTYQHLLDNPTLNAYVNYWSLLKSVEKVDDYTVNITLSQPFGAALLGFSSTPIIPNTAYEKNGDKLFTDQIMTGTGPWVFDKWVDGQYVHFTKNAKYWGTNNSYFDDVYVRFITEISTGISAQISGDVDAYITNTGIPSDLLNMYSGTESKIQINTVETGTILYLGFQCKEGSVFTDAKIRQAFSMAIDRNLIAETIEGGAKVNSSIFSSGCIGYEDSQTSDNYKYDPDAAKALLASSSYNGEEIMLSTNTSVENGSDILLAVSDMLNEVGFKTKTEVVEVAALSEMRATSNYDVYMVSAMFVGNDPYQFINYRILIDAHHSNFADADLNALITKSNTELNASKRTELLSQVNAKVADLAAPMISICQLTTKQPVSYGIKGLSLYTDGLFDCKYITFDASLVK